MQEEEQTLISNPEEVKKIFNTLDQDSNGLLNAKQFETLLEELHVDEFFTEIFQFLFKKNQKGAISYPQFYYNYLKLIESWETTKRVVVSRVFNAIDTSKCGMLDAKEVVKVFNVFQNPVTLDEANDLIERMAKDDAGGLTVDDICGICEFSL